MTGSERDTYRHGDLRAAALTAAIAIVEKKGASALALRGVADAVGVAHRSLYRHFKDREALIDAIAAQAYRRLAASLKTSCSTQEFSKRYASFALREPHLYDAMMSRTSASILQDADLKKATDELIAVSLDVLSDTAKDGETRRRQVMKLWMGLHGGLSLHRSGLIRARSNRAFTEELLRILELP
ncbi:MAG: TetR/AcrR family transcriptional regulator [Amphiplicatus sp.]